MTYQLAYQEVRRWPAPDTRARRWFASGPWDGSWVLQFSPTDLTADEVLVEYPPTVAVAAADWAAGAHTLFGLDTAGEVVDEARNTSERPGTDGAPGRWP